MNKRETHIVTGMTRDLYASRFDNKFVYDARNIRITAVKNKPTLLSVTNEKGTALFSVSGNIYGYVIGHAVLNNTLVLFTTEHLSSTNANPIPDSAGYDRIYRLDFSSDYTSATATLLFEGNLNFYYKNLLETLPFYENDQIKKVYWVDGRNQPRMIDIERGRQYNNDVFNFNRKISGNHTMKIEKYNTGGEFPAGTIQYCFNYFNKFGQETNIVDQSPLYYLSPKDKGLPADAMSTASFQIELSDLDGNYEYVRLYSIIRTSENATPIARIVGDYKIATRQELSPWVNDNDFEPFDFNDAYVVDLNTGETVFQVSSQYTEPALHSGVEVPILETQALLIESTGTLYAVFSMNTGNKHNKVKIFHDSDGIHLVRLGQSSVIRRSSFTGSSIGEVIAIDNGVIGSTIDASALLFIGGQDIIAGTITSKDNTLFLGNIEQKVPNIGTLMAGNSSVKDLVRGGAEPCAFDINGDEGDNFSVPDDGEYASGTEYYDYPIDNNKSSYDIKTFKARENYRLGIIAQYNTGQWSEVLWIGDLDETISPARNVLFTEHQHLAYKSLYKNPGFKFTVPQAVVSALKNAGFIRVAPVAVYPEIVDRQVICQGILSGTIYNVSDRYNNSPFVQADWRFRSGYSWKRVEAEVQCNPVDTAPTFPIAYDTDSELLENDTFVDVFNTQFYKDPSILSFHSPDVEENDELYSSEFSDAYLRIVGVSNLGISGEDIMAAETAAEVNVFISSEGIDSRFSGPLPFRDKTSISAYRNTTEFNPVYGNTDLSFAGYIDYLMDDSFKDEGIIYRNVTLGRIFKYTTFLWHRKGSLSSQMALSTLDKEAGFEMTAMYSKKLTSELRYARTAFFQPDEEPELQCFDLNITPPRLVETTSPLVQFDLSDGSKKTYYGDSDKILLPPFKNTPETTTINSGSGSYNLPTSKGYPIEVMGKASTAYISDDGDIPWVNDGERWLISEITEYNDEAGAFSKDPVLIQYRCPRHLIFGLTAETPAPNTIYQLGGSILGDYHTFWMPDDDLMTFVDVLDGKLSDTVSSVSGLISNSVLVGELCRNFTDKQREARFGGTSDEAIANNIWNRCGDSVYLDTDSDVTLYYKEGDTYIGRYDCLKSYPRTNEDLNQLVSIYSTELESRVNLDARYDKMRGLTDNTAVRPTNFNLFNHPGYEQKNQFFTYKAIDYNRYASNKYPNMFTWGLEKKTGADIDAWTSMPMTSTADAQGDLGEITRLALFNDNLFLFQNRGVAQILFNERVQIPTSDGQPIEITNGLKYSGYRYLSNQIGMTNKWSLGITPYGMYFIDDEKDTLYQFNGQQFNDLSGKAGMKTWLADIDKNTSWGFIRTWYDKVNSDLYFMTPFESLVYSEQIGNFTSFMDYGGLTMLVNMSNKLFATLPYYGDNGESPIWELWAGPYNMFFGEYKSYWLTFVSNTDPTVDKVFNTLGWRTTDFDANNILQPLTTFDTVRVWHDHQDTGEVSLVNVPNKPSILKKKFNVFRAFVPRDMSGTFAKLGRDRIRNTWACIQLARNTPNTDYMIFSDLDVDFFE